MQFNRKEWKLNIEFTKAKINAICEEIIYSFMNGERMDGPVDIAALVCRFFKLTVYYVRFADEEAEPYGYTSDGVTGIDVVINNKKVRYVFPKNTILLDIRLKNDEIKRREVLAHELMHYIDSIVNAYPVDILMMNDGSIEFNKYMDMMKKREWRADEGAAILLLPREVLIDTYRRHIGYDNLKVFGNSILMTEDKLKIAEIAKELKVSYEMTVKRLYDLELLEQHNVSEFLRLAFRNEDRAI